MSRRRPVLALVAVGALGAAAFAAGGALGQWQWQRAHDQSSAVEPEPRVAIADVMVPGQPGRGEGRLVTVEGDWSDARPVVVEGKEVDGTPAVLLMLPFAVDADATGTGSPATLAVLAGWLPADQAGTAPVVGADAALTGYVRSGEGSATLSDGADGPARVSALSTATVAGIWPAPTYSYLVVADAPAPGWRALPPPQAKESLDVRSVVYAVEWWVFGGFAAFVAARYIRDNGRTDPSKEQS